MLQGRVQAEGEAGVGDVDTGGRAAQLVGPGDAGRRVHTEPESPVEGGEDAGVTGAAERVVGHEAVRDDVVRAGERRVEGAVEQLPELCGRGRDRHLGDGEVVLVEEAGGAGHAQQDGRAEHADGERAMAHGRAPGLG
ncbi:hypothetical protein RB200_33815 [Streptomyces sp. PmtG]